MKITPSDMRLYAITDRRWLGGSTLLEAVEAALRGGAGIVQLREKDLDEASFLKEATEIRALCHRFGVPLIINDNAAVCLAAGADGVHVGQNDMEAGLLRKKLGPDKLIGVSAKTVEQALLAEAQGADYLGVGAVFATGSKEDARPIDWETFRAITGAVSIPVVAIGGITEENMDALSGSGAAGIAVISAVFAAEDIETAARKLREHSERLFA